LCNSPFYNGIKYEKLKILVILSPVSGEEKLKEELYGDNSFAEETFC